MRVTTRTLDFRGDDPANRSSALRVVAGTARGRRIITPDGSDVRPTSDRVREATFNALGSMGVLEGADVADLFAGSGALGLEALSRGAAAVQFVDSSSRALRAVESNLATLGFESRATLVRADALDLLARAPRTVDVALLDPPYDFDRWPELLATVQAGVVVIESDRAIDVSSFGDVARQRRYGGTVVTIARSRDRDDHGRPNPEDRS